MSVYRSNGRGVQQKNQFLHMVGKSDHAFLLQTVRLSPNSISLASVFCILKIHCLDQSAYQHSLSPQAYSLSQHIPLRARPLPRACTTRDGAIFHMGSTLAPHVFAMLRPRAPRDSYIFLPSMEVTTAPRDSYLFLPSMEVTT
jgi:hypothetical protein